MIKQAAVAFLVVALGGCGGDGGTGPAARLVGNWIALVGQCAAGVNFGSAGEFSENIDCPNSAGTGIDLEENIGSYTADASNIYVTLAKSTCSDMQASYYEPYVLSQGSLSLTEANDVVILAPNASAGGNGVATLGCFRSGAFTASPLAPL